MLQVVHGYMVDGQVFNTAAEANDYARLPVVKEALSVLVKGDEGFVKFLLDNQDEIQKAFEAGVIARVTKAERAKLGKAMDYICEKLKDEPKAKFVVENAVAIKESFRWPGVKRLSPEEKATETLSVLTKLADETAAKWLIDNKDALLAAYDAGIVKRPAPSGNGLAEYLAAKKAGPEAFAEYTAKREAAKAAEAEAKAAAKASE